MKRLFCLVNLHSWSAWVHIPSRCVDERFCKECSKVASVNRHRFGKWEEGTQNVVNYVDGAIQTVGRFTIQQRSCLDCNFHESVKAYAK